jgi:hypothetical protein
MDQVSSVIELMIEAVQEERNIAFENGRACYVDGVGDEYYTGQLRMADRLLEKLAQIQKESKGGNR